MEFGKSGWEEDGEENVTEVFAQVALNLVVELTFLLFYDRTYSPPCACLTPPPQTLHPAFVLPRPRTFSDTKTVRWSRPRISKKNGG